MSMTQDDLNLVAAAANAAGAAPTDPTEYLGWRNRVSSIAMDLHKLASEVSERASFLNTFTFEKKEDGAPFPERRRLHAIIIGVDQHASGRGIVGVVAGPNNEVESGKMTIEEAAAAWRKHRDNNQAFSRDGALKQIGVEQFRTGFLNTEEGSAVFAAAEALIGQRVVIFKDMEEFSRDGDSVKMRIVRHIEPSGALGPVTQQPADRRPAQQAQPAAAKATTQQDDTPTPAPAPAEAPSATSDDQTQTPAARAEALLKLSPSTGAEIVTLATEHFGLDRGAVGKVADDMGITDRRNLAPEVCKRIWDRIVTDQLGEAAF